MSLLLSSVVVCFFFFFSSRRRHTRYIGDWSSDVCSSDLSRPHRRGQGVVAPVPRGHLVRPQGRPPLGHEPPEGPHEGAALQRGQAHGRSEERRVGKECRSGWSTDHGKEKENTRYRERGGS